MSTDKFEAVMFLDDTDTVHVVQRTFGSFTTTSCGRELRTGGRLPDAEPITPLAADMGIHFKCEECAAS